MHDNVDIAKDLQETKLVSLDVVIVILSRKDILTIDVRWVFLFVHVALLLFTFLDFKDNTCTKNLFDVYCKVSTGKS